MRRDRETIDYGSRILLLKKLFVIFNRIKSLKYLDSPLNVFSNYNLYFVYNKN